MQGRGGAKHSTYNKDLRVACKVGVDPTQYIQQGSQGSMQGRGGSKHSTYNKDLRVACKVGADPNTVHTTRISG